jgi:predicted ATP-dependent endonuclease of OLD family
MTDIKTPLLQNLPVAGIQQIVFLLELDNEIVRPVLTLLLVEEPENHIAPQILGRVIKILKQLSTRPDVMVFMSSDTLSLDDWSPSPSPT